MSDSPDEQEMSPTDSPYASPAPEPSRTYAGNADTSGDATGGVIPYKNAPALLAYYFGIFSLLPCVGLLLAVPAFVLGIVGLKKRRENPAVKGAVHAWIGIILGGFFTLLWGGLIVFGFVGALFRSS
jgi:hypothetical protein